MDPKKAITERTEAAARDLYGASRRAASPGWLRKIWYGTARHRVPLALAFPEVTKTTSTVFPRVLAKEQFQRKVEKGRIAAAKRSAPEHCWESRTELRA